MKQGSGCRKEHKPFGTEVFLKKQRRCIPNSPEVLPWESNHEELRRSIPKPPQILMPIAQKNKTQLEQTYYQFWIMREGWLVDPGTNWV